MNSQIEIIPAIDLMDGKCVRLVRGDFRRKKIYECDPLGYVERLVNSGLRRLHVVDLDGAAAGKTVHFQLVEKICSTFDIEVDFGGGIKSVDDIKRAIDAGVKYITLSSVPVQDPEKMDRWLGQFGEGAFLLCADLLDEKMFISGWKEAADQSWEDFFRNYLEKGVNRFLCTDISRDGTMIGPSTSLYKRIIKKFPEIFLIASGGVATVGDIWELNAAGLSGVVTGKALLDGAIKLSEIAVEGEGG